MNIQRHSTDKPVQNIPVYLAADFHVCEGANLNDPLSFATELVLDDVYELSGAASTRRLSLLASDAAHFTVAKGGAVGTPGAALHLDSCLTMMSSHGQTVEMLVLVEVDEMQMVREVFILPLVPMMARTTYRLVGISRDTARRKFAQVACVSFTRGTRITTESGAQRRIEDLRVGDRVLTRDAGLQPIRWIGQTTVRAAGEFAPIVITKGTLNNVDDLVVSPDHRLFIYQREDRIGAGRSELLVKARYLVDGETVHVQEGGFVDYFQLLFDRHHIIYAEGIAAETLLIDRRTSPVLPRELSDRMAAPLAAHGNRPHMKYEVNEKLLDRPGAAHLLRRASGK